MGLAVAVHDCGLVFGVLCLRTPTATPESVFTEKSFLQEREHTTSM
jgi:hypothetical protein